MLIIYPDPVVMETPAEENRLEAESLSLLNSLLNCAEDFRRIQGIQTGTPNLRSAKVFCLLRLEGFEPPTYGSVGHCSIQLSYRRIKDLRQLNFSLTTLLTTAIPSPYK